MFESLFGMPLAARFIIAFVVVLALIGLTAWLVRRFASNRLGAGNARGRQPRLAVIDAANVDARRRLILIRRDNIEHLLMIGGPTDIVVEPNIVRAGAPRESARDNGARLPNVDTGWPLQPINEPPARGREEWAPPELPPRARSTDTLAGMSSEFSSRVATPDVPLDAAGLEARYAQEMALAGPVIDKAIAQLDRNEAAANALLGCGTAAADPACGIAVHYLTWGARGMQPAAAFRSLVLGFALAARDPRFVGVNIVQPEDWPVALRDYDLHMAMFRFLEGKYPQVRPTLHAGELAMGQVAPPHLRDHIAKAIAAGAQRIGHGTDIALEQDARATMATMARKGIAVEINLSSNDVILGVKGGEHPLNLYRRMGVPVSIDSMKSAVVAWALDAGAKIVNDVWGLQRDLGLLAPVQVCDDASHQRESVLIVLGVIVGHT